MRILSLNYEFPPLGGGGGYVAKTINEILLQQGFTVDLVTMRFRELKHEETINGVRIFRIKSFRKKAETCETPEMASFVASAIPFVLKLTKKHKYDLVHCHFALPTGIVAYVISKMRGLDYILTTHGSDIPGYNPDRFRLEHKFTGPLLKAIMKRARTIVALSNYLKDMIENNVCAGLPITVIPNGIEPDMFATDQKRNNWILMSGRFLERKGFQYALEALKDFPFPDWEIHLAGDGPYRKELEALAKKVKNKVVFHGWLDRGCIELKNLYERSKIFILPSDAENASIALLEAMNAGLAVITTASTGCRETAGDAALLVDPHDVNNIKRILLDLAQNDPLIKEFGEKARKRCLENFSWKAISEKYIEIYRHFQ